MDFFNDIFHNLALLEFYFLNIIYILLYIDFILSIFFQHSNILTRASHHWCLASNIVLVIICYCDHTFKITLIGMRWILMRRITRLPFYNAGTLSSLRSQASQLISRSQSCSDLFAWCKDRRSDINSRQGTNRSNPPGRRVLFYKTI